MRSFARRQWCRHILTGVALALFNSLPIPGVANDATNQEQLTLERLFGSNEFDSEGVPSIVWRRSGSGYYVLETPRGGGSGKDLVRHDPTHGTREIVVPAHAFVPPGGSHPLSIEDYSFSDDESKLLIYTNSKRVWRRNTRGDYWVLDIASRELKKLGGDAPPSSLMFAQFSPDASRVAYVCHNDLFTQHIRDLTITPLTTNGSPVLINGTADWVYEEELDLRAGFRWSPGSQWIAYWQLDISRVRVFQLINNTEGLYPRTVDIPYPKVGEENAAARAGIVFAQGGATRWLDIPGDPSSHYLARLDWASNSTEVILQQFNRVQNTNRVMLADAASGETRTIWTETDAAWLENENPTRWVQQGRHFVWLSDRDGWRHAYLVSRDGQRTRQITRGRWDIIDLEAIDDCRGWLYFTASPRNPTQRYLFRVPLKGGKPKRLTPQDQPGTHDYQISPDGLWAVHTWSGFLRPPMTEIISLPEHKSIRSLAANTNLVKNLESLNLPTAEFFRVQTADDVILDGWCLRPADLDSARKYPVLFHVYGEPHGQTVRDAWGGKAHLWHVMLAQQGYVVISVDNRGTAAPRGRAWRKAVHRQVGILGPADQAAAVQALEKRWPYLDPQRVGIWGWSGGGSSSLHAIFQYPDLYQTAIAVAAVPNQRYYDTIYQERYMGLPEDNPEGYRLGSPLHHARNLKGQLLLIHGTGDDNVHYQGLEALVNELVAYNKPFTMMAYPNRTHSISEGRNTPRHLYELMTRFLHENLPLKQRRAEISLGPIGENRGDVAGD